MHVRVKESRCVWFGLVQLTTTNPNHARARQRGSDARCPNLSKRHDPDTQRYRMESLGRMPPEVTFAASSSPKHTLRYGYTPRAAGDTAGGRTHAHTHAGCGSGGGRTLQRDCARHFALSAPCALADHMPARNKREREREREKQSDAPGKKQGRQRRRRGQATESSAFHACNHCPRH
jgi:hypothetical protein